MMGDRCDTINTSGEAKGGEKKTYSKLSIIDYSQSIDVRRANAGMNDILPNLNPLPNRLDSSELW